MTDLILPTYKLHNDIDAALVIEHQQEITDEFLNANKAKRDASSSAPMGDFHQVAAIPTAVVEKWQREGFNIFDKNTTAQEIMARLKAESLDAFLTTTKRI